MFLTLSLNTRAWTGARPTWRKASDSATSVLAGAR